MSTIVYIHCEDRGDFRSCRFVMVDDCILDSAREAHLMHRWSDDCNLRPFNCCKPLINLIDRLFIRQPLWFRWMKDSNAFFVLCSVMLAHQKIILPLVERLRSRSWATVKRCTPKQQPTQKNHTNACCPRSEVFQVFGRPLSRAIQHSLWILCCQWRHRSRPEPAWGGAWYHELSTYAKTLGDGIMSAFVFWTT
jgi:hypothetical protein